MSKQNRYLYDVFISYNHGDKGWVQSWLLHQLEMSAIVHFIVLGFRRYFSEKVYAFIVPESRNEAEEKYSGRFGVFSI
jgi:hypothetical protein